MELNVGVKCPPVSAGLPACVFLCLFNPSEQAAIFLNPRLLVCIAAIIQGLLILYTHSNTERRTCMSGPVLPLSSMVVIHGSETQISTENQPYLSVIQLFWTVFSGCILNGIICAQLNSQSQCQFLQADCSLPTLFTTTSERYVKAFMVSGSVTVAVRGLVSAGEEHLRL